MKKKSEKQKDLDQLKTDLAKVSTVILTTFQGITPGTSAVTVPFQTPQTLLSPPDLATGVDTSTEFSWTPSDQGITLFILAGGQTEIVVFTGRTTAHLPDLSAYGVTLPATTPITWAAWSIGPWSSVDALAGSGAIFPVVPISFETHLRSSSLSSLLGALPLSSETNAAMA